MTDCEFIIQLDHRTREDGSVLITSPHLPLFAVVGDDAQSAHQLAMELMPEYLKANVPDFVDLRPVETVDNLLLGRGTHSVPAFVLARMGEQRGQPVGRSQAT